MTKRELKALRARRVRPVFDRIMVPRFTRDVDELRTWAYDIRAILSAEPLVRDRVACPQSAQDGPRSSTGPIQSPFLA